jgi:hypothetical protein
MAGRYRPLDEAAAIEQPAQRRCDRAIFNTDMRFRSRG